MTKYRSLWLGGCACLISAAPAAAQTTGLLGNAGGARTALGNLGITLQLNDSENLLANTTGGVKQGATLQGVTTGVLDMDTGKSLGLAGGTLQISALQIHGRALSPYYLDDLQSANGNEAENTTRLWELWYDQAFAGGQADVKLGQQSIDNEFIIAKDSGLFVNTMAGWPLVPSSDLYGGGPAYPLASLGIRGQVKFLKNQTLLAGVFDDNPGGGAFSADAQALDAGGTRFNTRTGALLIAEWQLAVGTTLPGAYKLGVWYDTGAFPDQLYGTDGLPLASPQSNGMPKQHHGNDSLYAVADQTIWQSPADTARQLAVFGRIMGTPAAQNLINFSFNGGVTLAAPLPGRDNDEAGLDFGLGHVSSRAAAGDEAAGLPARGVETLLEATYQAQLTPWLQVQPDVQYIIDPGAGLLNPDGTGQTLTNELVAGVRVITTF